MPEFLADPCLLHCRLLPPTLQTHLPFRCHVASRTAKQLLQKCLKSTTTSKLSLASTHFEHSNNERIVKCLQQSTKATPPLTTPRCTRRTILFRSHSHVTRRIHRPTNLKMLDITNLLLMHLLCFS